MLVNKKFFKEKEPENVSLVATIAFVNLYSRGPGPQGDIAVTMRDFMQSQIDKELGQMAETLTYEEQKKEAMKQYVR